MFLTASLQGASQLRFVAPGRGLLFGEDSLLVGFDDVGQLRRAFALSPTTILNRSASSGGAFYATTADFSRPGGELLVRFDATAATQSSWTLPGTPILYQDWEGRAYLGFDAFHLQGAAVQGAGLASLSLLASDGSLAWTVDTLDKGAHIAYIGMQDAGQLVAVAGNGSVGDCMARIASDGRVSWQLNLDGAASGADADDTWATGDGGAWLTWESVILMAQGVGGSGFCRIAPDGAVRTFANPLLGETLVAFVPEAGGFASKGSTFVARGSGGGLFHLRPLGTSLAVDRTGFVGASCTAVESHAEPESGELLAKVETSNGIHLVRWRKDGSVRWAKRIDGFNGLGEWRGLPAGGALVVLGPPIGAQKGVVSCVASIGSEGTLMWVRDAIGLSTSSSHGMRVLADGGAALWWGGKLMIAGPQGEFRSQRKLVSDAGLIVDLVPKRGSGAVLAVQSPGQIGVAFFSTDFLGASAGATCLMTVDSDLLAGVGVPTSATQASSVLVPASADVFVVTPVNKLGNPASGPVLAPAAPIVGESLSTVVPCGP